MNGNVRWILATVFPLALGMLGSLSGHAQLATATISGTVTDVSGAIVPGAMVTIKNLESGLARTSETDSNGSYRVPSLPVGQYEVDAERAGFKRGIRQGITLVVGQQAIVNLTLEIGDVQQQVMVTAEAPLVNTTLAPTSGLISERQVKDLPLNGRSFDQLLTLNTGTANVSSNRAANQPGNLFSVAGRRPEENRFLLNGVDFVGVSAGVNTSTPNGSAGAVLGVDAVREFNVVQYTYGAEFGKLAGGQINVVTSSGTNQLHGSAFEFLRNDVLDARNFFDQPLGRSIPPFRRNQFGGSGGGPLKKDKVFLFGNYEGLRQRLGVSDVAIVPDNNARRGLLPNAQGVPTPVPNLKPGILPFANAFWPAPNGPELGGGLAISFANPVQKLREDYGLFRSDVNVSAKDSFFANYVIQDGENANPSANPNFVRVQPLRSQVASVQETHVFSPAFLNVATVGFSRANTNFGTIPTVPIPENLLFITGQSPGTISIGGSTTGAGSATITAADGNTIRTNFARNLFTWADDLHYIKGNHSLSAGFWIQRIQNNKFGFSISPAIVTYPTLAAFLTDSPTAFQTTPTVTGLGWRSTEAAWYVQDEIKLKPNLTLRLGLRYEATTDYNETSGRCANFIFDQNGVVQTDPRIGRDCLLENNATALLQPRVGLAWDPTGTGTWAVRAGFGIFNNLQDNLDQAFSTNPPFNARATTSSPLLSVIPIPAGTPPLPSCSPTRGQPCAIFQPGQVDPDLHTPTIQEWSLTVERKITRDLALQIGYVGSQSYHLEVGRDSNTVLSQVCTDPQGCVSGGVRGPTGRVPQGTEFLPPGTRPNPFLSRVFERDFPGTSSYHALNVSLAKRPSHGLVFKTNYTYSKVLDVNSQLDTAFSLNTPSGAPNPRNLALLKGPASFNLKHQFNANFSYELPFGKGKRWGGGASGLVEKLIGGWQWNGILTAQSGFPFTPTVGSNISGSGDTGNPDVPNRNPAFSGPVILGDPNRYFNPNAFLFPTAGTFGNAGRNQFPGPNLNTFDTSLFKKLSINERWNLQFRAEAFNITNRANFGPPRLGVFSGANISPSAGLITTTATSSRQIQFALKLSF